MQLDVVEVSQKPRFVQSRINRRCQRNRPCTRWECVWVFTPCDTRDHQLLLLGHHSVYALQQQVLIEGEHIASPNCDLSRTKPCDEIVDRRTEDWRRGALVSFIHAVKSGLDGGLHRLGVCHLKQAGSSLLQRILK